MANKKKKTTKSVNKKLDNVNTSFKEEGFKVLKILISVLVFFGIFYLLTVYLTNRDTSDTTSSEEVNDVVIQYEEILAGSSFSVDKDEYLVVYYDKSSEELKSDMTTLISNYEGKEEHLSIYTVDMSSAFNKEFISNQSNKTPNNISELEINGSTLIKFSNGNVVDYVEGYDSIAAYLG